MTRQVPADVCSRVWAVTDSSMLKSSYWLQDPHCQFGVLVYFLSRQVAVCFVGTGYQRQVQDDNPLPFKMPILVQEKQSCLLKICKGKHLTSCQSRLTFAPSVEFTSHYVLYQCLVCECSHINIVISNCNDPNSLKNDSSSFSELRVWMSWVAVSLTNQSQILISGLASTSSGKMRAVFQEAT